jgi:nucleoside-diphosphate-sugar epimerase
MRIFITGASGFIGGTIAQAISSEHEVLASWATGLLFQWSKACASSMN